MIDVNKITSVLAKMPDAQLQRYAQMHKADPYIMALAMSESNRRKTLRAASQAPAQAQQPKVVDQEIARMGDMQNASPEQMARLSQLLEARKQAEYEDFTGGSAQQLPEDQGIGRLNAGNMNFAGGGIIAFADGGGVERYNGNSGSWVDNFLYSNTTPVEQARRKRIQEEAEAKRLPTPYEQERAANMASVAAGKSYRPEDYGVTTAAAPAFQDPRVIGATPVDATVGSAAQPLDKGADKTAAINKAPPITGSGSGSGSDTATVGGSSKGSASLEALFKKLQPSAAEYAAIDAKETSVANALKDLGKSAINEFEAEEAKRGDVFKGREARLAERKIDLGKMSNKNEALALMLGGAAAMGTPGGLAKAISRGVTVGGAQYAAGIDKINAAQERLLDAQDRLEELRVNRDDLTSRERRQLKNQAKQYELEAQKLFLDGAQKKFGYKREDAKTMFAGITTLMGQETAAGATIQAAKIRSQDQKDYLAEIRGGNLVEQTRKSIMDNITKANPYADEPTRQRLYQTEWAKALQSNPALAKYAGVASGGGGASSADPLGLR